MSDAWFEGSRGSTLSDYTNGINGEDVSFLQIADL